MTKYRIKQNGFGRKWLEYKKIFIWVPVPVPYYDNVYGREFCDEYLGGWLCNSFEWFVNKYPDINEYLENKYYPKQKELKKEAEIFWRNYEDRKNKIKYL